MITTSCQVSGQFLCPFVQALNDPRSNRTTERFGTHQRRLPRAFLRERKNLRSVPVIQLELDWANWYGDRTRTGELGAGTQGPAAARSAIVCAVHLLDAIGPGRLRADADLVYSLAAAWSPSTPTPHPLSTAACSVRWPHVAS